MCALCNFSFSFQNFICVFTVSTLSILSTLSTSSCLGRLVVAVLSFPVAVIPLLPVSPGCFWVGWRGAGGGVGALYPWGAGSPAHPGVSAPALSSGLAAPRIRHVVFHPCLSLGVCTSPFLPLQTHFPRTASLSVLGRQHVCLREMEMGR